MALTIRRTGSEDYGQHIKALIFGDPGAGKTLISSTFPNPFYASAEGGLMSIADKNIPYTDIKTLADLRELKNSLDQTPEKRAEILGTPVDTVVVDTLDEVQKIMMAERLKATKNSAMQQQDWGWLLEQMRGLIRGLRNIPINVVFTCHLKEVSDGESGRTWYKPSLQGAISDDVPGYVDLSLLLQTSSEKEVVEGKLVEVQKRHLITVPNAKYGFLKDRSGKLPREIEVNFEDDYERIRSTIFDGINIADGVEYEVETPQPALTTEPEPVSIEEAEVVAVETKVEKPKAKTSKSAPKETVKPAVSTAPAVKVEPQQADKTLDAPEKETTKDGVVVRNKLPEGVVPQPKGHGTNIYCTMCGGEVETEQRAEFSRIRHRRILDDACYESETAKQA